MSVETTEFIAMVRRMIRAAGRRVAQADEVELAALIELSDELQDAIAMAVSGQRESGRSWQAIAAATGTTRQAAHARWAHRQPA